MVARGDGSLGVNYFMALLSGWFLVRQNQDCLERPVLNTGRRCCSRWSKSFGLIACLV